MRAVIFVMDRGSPLFWVYLPTTLLFGLFGWWRFERSPGEGLRHFLQRHLSAKLWWHRSARVDYRYYLVNAVLFAVLIAPFLVWGAWIADLIRTGFSMLLGDSPRWQGQWLGSWPVKLAFTLAFFVAYDFGRWLGHTLMHDVPPLWEFHKGASLGRGADAVHRVPRASAGPDGHHQHRATDRPHRSPACSCICFRSRSRPTPSSVPTW